MIYNDDENYDCRKSVVVIGGREGEIDIPDKSMDVLQHCNAKYVQVFINTLTQPSMDVLQHCCNAKSVRMFINTLTQPAIDVVQHCCNALQFNPLT